MHIQKSFFFTSFISVYMHIEEIYPELVAVLPVKKYHENKLVIKRLIICRDA